MKYLVALPAAAAAAIFFWLTIPYQYLIPVSIFMGGLGGWFLYDYYEGKDR